MLCDTHNVTTGNINIDDHLLPYIEKYNLTKDNNDYFDFTLEPSDVLLVPSLWGHAVENLTPYISAMSMRFYPEPMFNQALDSISIRLYYTFQALFESIKSKLKNWNAFTFLDLFYIGKISNNETLLPVFDYHPQFKAASFIDQNEKIK